MNTTLIDSPTTSRNFYYAVKKFLLGQRWFSGCIPNDAPFHCIFKPSLLPAPFQWMEVQWGCHTYRVPVAREAFGVTQENSILIYQNKALNLTLSDAFGHALFLEGLLRTSIDKHEGEIPISPSKLFSQSYQPIRVNQSDQTNTCVFYGLHYFLKFYRKIELGQNLECHTLRALQHQAHRDRPLCWPILLADVQDPSRPEPSTAWCLQKLIPNATNVWEYLSETLTSLHIQQTQPSWDGFEESQEWRDIHQVFENIGSSLANLHHSLALISPSEWVSQPMDLQTFSAEWEAFAKELECTPQSPEISVLIHDITQLVAKNVHIEIEPLTIYCQRIHGDLHLGQLLLNEKKEIFITDFDGEPIRREEVDKIAQLKPREEDHAGLVRSIDYLVNTAAQGNLPDFVQEAIREVLIRTLLKSYEQVSLAYPLSNLFLENAILRKSLRECHYEWNYRRSMLHVPLVGLKTALIQLSD